MCSATLYRDIIGRYWDADAHQAALDQEDADRDELEEDGGQ